MGQLSWSGSLRLQSCPNGPFCQFETIGMLAASAKLLTHFAQVIFCRHRLVWQWFGQHTVGRCCCWILAGVSPACRRSLPVDLQGAYLRTVCFAGWCPPCAFLHYHSTASSWCKHRQCRVRLFWPGFAPELISIANPLRQKSFRNCHRRRVTWWDSRFQKKCRHWLDLQRYSYHASCFKSSTLPD